MKVLPLRLLQQANCLSFFRRLRELDDALFELIRERTAVAPHTRPPGILSDLLAAHHADGSPLGDQEIRDAVLTLLFAGHETTSIALAWALEQIVSRSDVVERITCELRESTHGELPTAETMDSLTVLEAAIRESLRVRTILPFVVRMTKQPFTAGGREYPPGVLLCPSSHLVHGREDLYPEPERFRPERFLERKFAPHEWFPFGGGNRVCLGMAFALYEMKVVLSTLFSQVRLSRPAGSRSLPVRRGIVLAPDDDVQIVVSERLPPSHVPPPVLEVLHELPLGVRQPAGEPCREPSGRTSE
jgi:cytochrome P450